MVCKRQKETTEMVLFHTPCRAYQSLARHFDLNIRGNY